MKIDKIKFDKHVHPEFSQDAQGTYREYVESALNKGLTICFTSHIDLNPNRTMIDRWVRVNGVLRAYRPQYFEQYMREIRELADEYKGRVFAGFEFSYWPHFEDLIAEFIRQYEPDFTIGSIHSIDDVGFTAGSESYYPLRFFTPESFLERYLEGINALASSNLFDSIGHIDGYKKYASRHWDIKLMRKIEDELYPKVFEVIAENSKAIEINTAAIRKGLDDFYPRSGLLSIAAAKGVRISSLGSDAHRPEDLGFMFKQALEKMKELGLKFSD